MKRDDEQMMTEVQLGPIEYKLPGMNVALI